MTDSKLSLEEVAEEVARQGEEIKRLSARWDRLAAGCDEIMAKRERQAAEETSRSEPVVGDRRVCRDCKFVILGREVIYWQCGHPTSSWRRGPSLVSGTDQGATQLYCSAARTTGSHGMANLCGPEGRFWERRE